MHKITGLENGKNNLKIEGKEYRTIWFDEKNQAVKIIDQTKLPHQFIIKDLKTVKDAMNAIKAVSYTHLTLPTKA